MGLKCEIMKVQQQAYSIMEAFNGNKEYALTAVAVLIAEHTWNEPINWNIRRKQYWTMVKECIESMNTNHQTPTP